MLLPKMPRSNRTWHPRINYGLALIQLVSIKSAQSKLSLKRDFFRFAQLVVCRRFYPPPPNLVCYNNDDDDDYDDDDKEEEDCHDYGSDKDDQAEWLEVRCASTWRIVYQCF